VAHKKILVSLAKLVLSSGDFCLHYIGVYSKEDIGISF
jgi:hypothetical protein